MHERLDGGKADVSGTSTVSAVRFQMTQEVHDKRSINLLQIQFGGSNLQAPAGVFKQEFERVRIGVASIRARPPLKRQALLQKSRDVGRDQVHGRPPAKKAWHESAMPFISSGVASRYQ